MRRLQGGDETELGFRVLVISKTLRLTHIQVSKCMRRLQGGDDALQPGHLLERVQRLLVSGREVLCPAPVLQGTVLRPNARVVQPAPQDIKVGGIVL